MLLEMESVWVPWGWPLSEALREISIFSLMSRELRLREAKQEGDQRVWLLWLAGEWRGDHRQYHPELSHFRLAGV